MTAHLNGRAALTPLRENLVLYAVTDGGRPSDVEEAIRGGARCIQLRDKICSDAELLDRARQIHRLTRSFGIPLIINDRVAVFEQSGAEGLHIGQGDGQCADIRKRIGRTAILGVSVHNSEQAIQAAWEGADYVGAGAVFPTGTKADAQALDRETLEAICAATALPVVAIGGICEHNILALAGTGISGIAAVSAIFSDRPAIRERTRRLATLAALVVSPRAGKP